MDMMLQAILRILRAVFFRLLVWLRIRRDGAYQLFEDQPEMRNHLVPKTETPVNVEVSDRKTADISLEERNLETPVRFQKQITLVMRHGHRLDDDIPDWQATAERPWDVPLSRLGRAQVWRHCRAFAKDISLTLCRIRSDLCVTNVPKQQVSLTR